jgi:hypothetical protein
MLIIELVLLKNSISQLIYFINNHKLYTIQKSRHSIIQSNILPKSNYLLLYSYYLHLNYITFFYININLTTTLILLNYSQIHTSTYSHFKSYLQKNIHIYI